jgi:hypothetical protein
VLTEGTVALMGDSIDPALVEPVEAMAEATLLLATCGPDDTGGVHRSLDLLDQRGLTVGRLDGSGPYEQAGA